jgi:protease II
MIEVLAFFPGILKWVKLIDNFEGEYDYVTNEGTVFTFKTNRNSPNYRLINIDFTDPDESKWKVLVPEHEKDVLGKAGSCLETVLARTSKSQSSMVC